MKSLKISIKNNNVRITQEGDLTVNEALSLSFEMFASVVLQTLEGVQDNKEMRRSLYNQIVSSISDLADRIYPEINEEKGSAEDFLKHLEDKSAEIDKKLEELKKKEKENGE